MRALDLRPYHVPVPQRTESGEVTSVTFPYDVVESLIGLVYNPEQNLNGPELLRRHALAERIKAAGEEFLMEEAEYEVIANAAKTFKGFRQTDVEFVRRILEAEEVEVVRA